MTIRIAQALSFLSALILAGLGLFYFFNPTTVAGINNFDLTSVFGTTNMRTFAAPMLMLGVMSLLAGLQKEWKFLVPGALYFLFVALARLFGIFVDGFEASTLRGLVLAVVFFAALEVALQLFRRAQKKPA